MACKEHKANPTTRGQVLPLLHVENGYLEHKAYNTEYEIRQLHNEAILLCAVFFIISVLINKCIGTVLEKKILLAL